MQRKAKRLSPMICKEVFENYSYLLCCHRKDVRKLLYSLQG
ncbi:hypothetical protein AM1_A0225 (plasmid) [Acaryochloris marina MBIC11017]|uniref:Uncharacterized protein n=1 Tax=Acaryochloris marina (strain MBIC 11017) TaxID=329726 RepID=A8ZKM8_ACAM1|nr:hypothetical protein AM1_A0225 [Acaryochloris marina MBIC11017]